MLWIAYQEIEGLAPVDSWLQTASTNFYIDRAAGQKKGVIDDYNPYRKRKKKKIMTAEDQVALFKFYYPGTVVSQQEPDGQ